MIDAIQLFLDETPLELAGDIAQIGVVLIGGGALLRDIDEAISERTNLPVVVPDSPELASVLGALEIYIFLEPLEQMQVLGNLVPPQAGSYAQISPHRYPAAAPLLLSELHRFERYHRPIPMEFRPGKAVLRQSTAVGYFPVQQ